MRKGFKKSICTLLALSLTLGCVSSTSNIVDAKSKVKLSSTKISMTVKQKKSIRLKGVKGKKVKWSTSNKKIVTIKTSGKNKKKCTLTAKKSGNTTVSAKYRGKTYKCKVTVKAKNTTTTNGVPTNKPSVPSNDGVTNTPITNPGTNPTGTPVVTESPTDSPSANPTDKPVITDSPTDSPSKTPDVTIEPTEKPVVSTETPDITIKPTENPVTPTEAPSTPSVTSTVSPTVAPTNTPGPVHEHTVVTGGTKDCHSKCSECGEVIEDGTKHKFTSETIKEAIHGVQDGLVRYTCSCGYSYDETVSQHTFTSKDGHVCSVCGEVNTSLSTYVASYDLSANEDNGIVGYLFKSDNPDFTDEDVYDVYIRTLKSGSVLNEPDSRCSNFCGTQIDKYSLHKVVFLNKVKAGESCNSLFLSLGKTVFDKYSYFSCIDYLEYLDTSNTKDMAYMFENAKLGGSPEITLDTSNVTTMENMFLSASRINRLILNFKGGTSKVKNMSGMFQDMYRCYDIQNKGIFDTSNVEDISSMFSNFADIVGEGENPIGVVSSNTYDFIEGLNTGNCRNMANVFSYSFTYEKNFELDLTGWDTDKVETISNIFSNLNSRNSTGFTLKFNFNTRNVKNISYVFNMTGKKSFENGNGKIYVGSSFSSLSDELEYNREFFGYKSEVSLNYVIKIYTTSTDSYNLLTNLAKEQDVAEFVNITKIN